MTPVKEKQSWLIPKTARPATIGDITTCHPPKQQSPRHPIRFLLSSITMESDYAPKFAPFFGMAGIAAAMVFGSVGAAYGTAKSGIGIAGVGTFRPDLIMKCLIPVVMSGIIAVYSLVISVLIAQDLAPPSASQSYALFSGFMHLACGLAVGMTGLAAGYCIGVVGDKGVRAYMEQSRIFVGMVLILIFGEVLGLYGLIVALLLNSRSKG
ncbi:v-type proton ATPase 16 kDa proteolipid subunit 2 [Claviceps cyperi]|nr:v-type proton ATPase 16 kDa proteolipid subunit 2 [Claviceps cyperi]